MKERIAALPEATDVQTNYEKSGLAVNFDLDRVRAARAGVTTRDIDNIFDDWFGQRRLTSFGFRFITPASCWRWRRCAERSLRFGPGLSDIRSADGNPEQTAPGSRIDVDSA